jgi:glycosyltransferase involved in cell wall biosynthesis
MIAVIVPDHNEELHLAACLASLQTAARDPQLNGESVMLVVALDACSDGSEKIARDSGSTCVLVNAGNVGIARAAGAQLALDAGARWLAFTDADSTVAPDWLAAQLGQRSDVVCGTVAVADWGSYGQAMQRHYDATYFDVDGHQHIHGANLGVSAAACERVGGFLPLGFGATLARIEREAQDQGVQRHDRRAGDPRHTGVAA